MENALSRTEKSDQVSCSTPQDQDPRSYICSFCKRGFSNAQALGGHMNIHRKDRARLKELSMEEEQLQCEDDSGNADEDVLRDQLQLTLSVKSSVPSAPNQKGERHTGVSRLGKTSMTRSSVGASSELDLELRLGPEPHEAARN